MSLSLMLKEEINKVIKTFITRVSDKYNLDNTELINLWEGDEIKDYKTELKKVSSKDSLPKTKSEIDYDVILKCNKTELIALCKTHGHKCSGTKSILMNRLLGKNDNDNNNNDNKPTIEKVTKTKQVVVNNSTIAKKLIANIPNILIRRNGFNNYEHHETGLVFDNEKQIVIGKQKDDGSIDPLTEDDIDKCNAFKFKFKIPVNLDQKSTLVNVKVDDLSEEEEDDLLEEEEDVLEEEEDILDEEDLIEEDDLIDDDLIGSDEEYITDDE